MPALLWVATWLAVQAPPGEPQLGAAGGADATDTVVCFVAVPDPLQVKVNVVDAVSAPVALDPLAATAPPGLILQLVAFADAQESVLDALYAIDVGEALKLPIVGAGFVTTGGVVGALGGVVGVLGVVVLGVDGAGDVDTVALGVAVVDWVVLATLGAAAAVAPATC